MLGLDELKAVYNSLYAAGTVRSRADFGRRLGYTGRTYITDLLNGNQEIPDTLPDKIRKVFGIVLPFTAPITAGAGGDTDLGDPQGQHKTKAGNVITELSSGYTLLDVPVVHQRSAASYPLGWGDEEYIETLPKHSITVKGAPKGVYRGFEIEADNFSMDDGTRRAIEPGDFVYGRLVGSSLWRASKIHFKDWPLFTIVTLHDGITTKEIIGHDLKTGLITCHCWNEDKAKFPDFTLHVDNITQIFNIVQHSKPVRR